MKFLRHPEKPSWAVSLVPFVFLVAVLVCVIRVFGADALAGGSQVALLFASALVVMISMVVYRVPWKKLEDAVLDNIRAVGSAIVILFLIGAIAGTWMVSGVVPTLIYYGLKVITPGIFLLAATLISALVAVMTGSSWTTIATIGVALIGIGTALGYDAGWTAGAIISGAYFGDKISPLSDTTILASSSSGTPLFTHIRYMMITTVPSFVIATVVFLVASLMHPTENAVQVVEISNALKDTFHGSTGIETGNEVLNALIATRGMTGMLNTVFLIVMAVTFGGVLAGSGMLQSLTNLLVRCVSRTASLVGATVGTGVFCNMITGDQYLSIILTSNLYRKLYEDKGYENRLLSRSVEDSATVVSVLIPWNSCGMTQATVLKVPTMDYLPYCLFNIISPLMSIFIAAIGYRIFRKALL